MSCPAGLRSVHTGDMTDDARFAAAQAHPIHGEALARPAPPPQLAPVVAAALFLVMWLVIGAIILAAFAEHGGLFVLFPLAILAFGVVAVGSTAVRALRKAAAPVERALAVVLDKRTDTTTHGVGDDRQTVTRYHVTLQFRDGTRRELATTARITGEIVRGDIGLAVARGGDLIDFHRYPV